jgi:hypothetical protein
MRRASWSCLFLAVTVSLVVPSVALAQTDATKFAGRESALWETVKNKQIDAIRKVFDKDYVAVYDTGIVGLTDEVGGINRQTLRSYHLRDLQVRRVDGLNVVVTYKADVDGEMEGQPLTGTYNALTLWHRQGNQWYVAAHSEMKSK